MSDKAELYSQEVAGFGILDSWARRDLVTFYFEKGLLGITGYARAVFTGELAVQRKT